MIESLTGSTRIVEKALDAAWLRNEAISDNIANVDTPNYKRKVVKFEEYLKDAENSSNIKSTGTSFPGNRNNNEVQASAKIEQDKSNLEYRLDGNNVDIEVEMASMAKNTIKYNTLIEGLIGRYSNIKYAISEGKR